MGNKLGASATCQCVASALSRIRLRGARESCTRSHDGIRGLQATASCPNQQQISQCPQPHSFFLCRVAQHGQPIRLQVMCPAAGTAPAGHSPAGRPANPLHRPPPTAPEEIPGSGIGENPGLPNRERRTTPIDGRHAASFHFLHRPLVPTALITPRDSFSPRTRRFLSSAAKAAGVRGSTLIMGPSGALGSGGVNVILISYSARTLPSPVSGSRTTRPGTVRSFSMTRSPQPLLLRIAGRISACHLQRWHQHQMRTGRGVAAFAAPPQLKAVQPQAVQPPLAQLVVAPAMRPRFELPRARRATRPAARQPPQSPEPLRTESHAAARVSPAP